MEMDINLKKEKEKKRSCFVAFLQVGIIKVGFQQDIDAQAGEALICAASERRFPISLSIHPFIRTAIWVSRIVLLLRSREKLSV